MLFCKAADLSFSMANDGHRMRRLFLREKWKRTFDITNSFHGSELHIIKKC